MKSTRTFLAGFFLLTTIALGIVAYRQYIANLRLQAEVSDPKTGLERELADAEKTIKELRDQLAAMRRTRANRSRALADGGPDGAGDGGPNGRQDRRAAMRALFDSPQFQALRAVQQKTQLDARYADLFKQLVQQYNLSPQQLDQFKSLLVQRQQATMDAAQAARQNGISPQSDPQAWQDALASATSDIDSQMKSDLGDAGYNAYQTYQQTAPQRNTVNQLQQSLSYTASPLTDAQSQQLVSLLQQTGSSGNGGGGFGGGMGGGGWGGPAGGGGGTAQITQQVIAQAGSFLSPAQVSALQQLQQAQQAQQQMGQLMRAQFQNRQGGGQ